MKYGIISDIHSNLEALEAVLEALAERGVERYVCCGDIVGYGADPVACLERVRALGCPVVMGNHDAAVAGRTGTEDFNQNARRAVEWTRERLPQEWLDYLASLPLTAEVGPFHVVHATLNCPGEWRYLMTTYEAKINLDIMTLPLCVFGHSHVPILFRRAEGQISFGSEVEFTLEEGVQYLVNVGSVGQPRDGDPRAAAAVFDEESGRFELLRVPYDIDTARVKIVSAGLPPALAARLVTGD